MWLLTNIIYGFDGSMIQFNKDGEPLLYEELAEVGELCRKLHTNIVTNGILLMDRKDVLKDNFDTITISVFEDDEAQFENIKRFVESVSKPRLLVKYLGKYNNKEFDKLDIQTLRRTIHNPESDTNYKGSIPPVPEFGICLDFLYKPSIDWQGYMYICNRFDPEGLGIIGDCKEQNLRDIWDSSLRRKYLEIHKQGRREEIALCATCTYWGCPTNG
jgi:radical SAM protein with 4Fe4S-binding SPASM domain